MFAPVQAGLILLVDRAHQGDARSEVLAARWAIAKIGLMPQRVRHIPLEGIPYQVRNTAKRVFNKLKHFRAIEARCDERDDHFLASMQTASICIWLRAPKAMA